MKIQHLLLAKRLWGYVDGTEVLREGAIADQQAEFQRNHKKPDGY